MSQRRTDAEVAAKALVGSLLALAVFWLWGLIAYDRFELGLGSPLFPTPRHLRVLTLWAVTGTTAASLLGVALYRWGVGRNGLIPTMDDRRFMLYASLIGGLVPALIRQWILRDTPVTDDEWAYRLAAQTLASGHLYLPSPPAKEFFDNLFLINDGKLFSQYFLGWPTLMAPGVALGLEGWMNTLYSAATVPPLFWTCRRYAGSRPAHLTILCYLSSPMLMVAAATGLSHTSCLALLTWLTWLGLRALEPEGRTVAVWAGVATLFAAAFFVRPLTALGIGTPLLVVLFVAWLRSPGRRLQLGIAFAIPALLLGLLFLRVNLVQSGNPWKPAYVRAVEYARENSLKFSAWEGHPDKVPDGAPDLRFGDLPERIGVAGGALLRLNFALFGWPVSLLFALLAVRRRPWLPLCTLGFFALVHLPLKFSGIDLFGPVHFHEAALPLLLLTAIGIGAFDSRRKSPERGSRLPTATPLVLAFVAVSALGYTAVRLRAAREIAAAARVPLDTADRAGIGHAVVFVRRPFVNYRCLTAPSRGWIYGRPNNSPDLADSILWVNDLGIERDRAFAADRFPDRAAFLMTWADGCKLLFLPLDRVRGTPEG